MPAVSRARGPARPPGFFLEGQLSGENAERSRSAMERKVSRTVSSFFVAMATTSFSLRGKNRKMVAMPILASVATSCMVAVSMPLWVNTHSATLTTTTAYTLAETAARKRTAVLWRYFNGIFLNEGRKFLEGEFMINHIDRKILCLFLFHDKSITVIT